MPLRGAQVRQNATPPHRMFLPEYRDMFGGDGDTAFPVTIRATLKLGGLSMPARDCDPLMCPWPIFPTPGHRRTTLPQPMLGLAWSSSRLGALLTKRFTRSRALVGRELYSDEAWPVDAMSAICHIKCEHHVNDLPYRIRAPSQQPGSPVNKQDMNRASFLQYFGARWPSIASWYWNRLTREVNSKHKNSPSAAVGIR